MLVKKSIKNNKFKWNIPQLIIQKNKRRIFNQNETTDTVEFRQGAEEEDD